MAKKKVSINVDLLEQINTGFTNRISKDDAVPLLTNNPPLIEVNANDVVDGMALVRLTQEGAKMVNGNSVNEVSTGSDGYAIIKGATLPPRKRLGRTGGSSKYQFDKMEIGDSFFVPATADNPEPVKKLASTISAANMKYAQKTTEVKQVERTKRGGPKNKAIIENGQKVKETVTVPVYKATRKFAMRGVKTGQNCGGWVAPSDGVLIARVELE